MPIAWELDAVTFKLLLACFDADPEQAGAKYEDLRRALVRFFEGRRMLRPEELADATFNRIMRKLDEGEQISNIYGYCKQAKQFILLEALRNRENYLELFDETNAQGVTPSVDQELDVKEMYLRCLDECLGKMEPEKRRLILDYYSKNKKDMAAEHGLNPEALANRAQRLRDKLEHCVAECVAKN